MAIDWTQLQQSLSNIGNQTSQLWWTNFYLKSLSNQFGSIGNLSNEFSGIGQNLSSLSSSVTQIPTSISNFGTSFNNNLTNIANVANQDVAGIGQIIGNAEGTFTNISNTFGQIGAEAAGVGNTINAIQNWDWRQIAIRGGLILFGVIVLIVGITKL